jgi:ATP-dependent exoDNAse (exonuclease V) beta subunit
MNRVDTKKIQFISAGAGSGKTFSLTKRLTDLLSSAQIAPAGVIATTFTTLAAGELKERVRGALIEAGHLRIANQMEQALIGTVNSVCGDLLRRFAFEAGMPPDQQVLEETQGDMLFYQAMERALANNKLLLRQMNTTCHRLQILDHHNQLNWRGEVKRIADAARANNQSAADIRHLGKTSADELLAHFPKATSRDLDRLLLNAIEHAMEGIDTDADSTIVTREYVSLITGIRAGLYKQRATWPEWIKLSKEMPGKKSKAFAEPIADIAIEYDKHSALHSDIRFFAEQAFAIAADSLTTYQEIKSQKGLIDFVDQEQRLYQLLDHPTVQDTLREELQLLMVDEFQDTSPIQLALFLKLSQLAAQVIWVGDIKQSIYGFRGSDPTLMTAVVQRVLAEGNAPEILEQSWRSTPELVSYINNVFVPAFSDTLEPGQVALHAARPSVSDQPAVETWRLIGGKKSERAQALANGLHTMMTQGRTVIDKHSKQARAATFSDIAILCRTHANLSEIAAALSDAKLPIRYKRPGLLGTPEGCLAMACLRRLIDPQDTLATSEIHTLTHCERPDAWIAQRLAHLNTEDSVSAHWLEGEVLGPVAALKAQRARLHFLTPVEVLRTAIDVGNVRESVYRWGPTEQRSQHRLNNLAALLTHADKYLSQCTAQNQPATATGLVLWLYQLAEAEEDTQATGNAEDAIQLVTHHGAKGLEWPIVIAMDLDADLKSRLWGLSVLPSPASVSLENPLANRRLRYWPPFNGMHSTGLPLLDQLEASNAGQEAMQREIQEQKRLLYVSLTRPRDSLIIALNNKKSGGEWLGTVDAPWMLPESDTLQMPDGSSIPTRSLELAATVSEAELPNYQPTWLNSTVPCVEKLSLRLVPSTLPQCETAHIGSIIELGDRLEINGDYEAAALGSALHAVIATTIAGQQATARVLRDYGLEKTLSVATADECARRFLAEITSRFQPVRLIAEYPIHYTNTNGQIISGWIDLLVETQDGFVLIDHKASPRARSDWEEIALGYSGQLHAYTEGIAQVTGRPVLGQWIHFGVTGGLVEVVTSN